MSENAIEGTVRKTIQEIIDGGGSYYTDSAIHSPNNIMVLINCYLFQPIEMYEAISVQEAIQMFLSYGAIEKEDTKQGDNQMYKTTPLGNAWMDALCRVPRPKSAYLDEMGRVL